ncbi:DUF262 domain-containing protein [Porphyromonas gulae]|uniref:GmrSD restriction endonucleases N-terminal domain-containing protein n=1 Tax=Porphyromonas gulae TaxID=111105 RepID=A0A0A2FBH8_9PORP|nr:DUF262 domain-containing protein [Porphyromonas gulae]KGN87427.1 hypothetical protein HR08_02240 [Porphyromonas gulae]
MPLFLSAEQKSVKGIFLNDDIYIIPYYQRPYSWTEEHCLQLYNDITQSFEEDRPYFVGNIIFAQQEGKEELEIIDGQQRLITLWLFIKAMSVIYPKLSKIKRLISVIPSWDEETEPVCKFNSKIIETEDQESLDRILLFTQNDFETEHQTYRSRGWERYSKENRNIVANAIAVYGMLWEFFEEDEGAKWEDFWEFLSNQVYLLPIILSDKELIDARNKALTIFETINNRGMDLQDADIFKAKLYDMAQRANEEDSFINRWQEITSVCRELNLTTDDLFRYYYQIIRGENRVLLREKGLRDFFFSDNMSPFKTGDYRVIVRGLTDTLCAVEKLIIKEDEHTNLAKWLQVLSAYTNQYPRYALVAYYYFYRDASDDEAINLVQKLIRYVYSKGATSTVKFEIYSIISSIAHQEDIKEYFHDVDEDMINNPGRLTNGLSLLYYHLKVRNSEFLRPYKVEKLLKGIDQRSRTWDGQKYSSLANYAILPSTLSNKPIIDRLSKYQELDYYCEYLSPYLSNDDYTENEFEQRRQDIKAVLNLFFGRNE